MNIEKNILISVIVPTYGSALNLKRTLESLSHQTFTKEDYEIIIVDDGSPGNAVEKIVRKYETKCQIKYIKQKHAGPSMARNTGIRNARGRIIAFTDDDCSVGPEWMREITGSLNSADCAGVYGSTYSDIPPSYFIHSIITKDKAITANLALKKEVLKKVEMFDVNFRLPSCEDGDLFWRVTSMGEEITHNPKMRVYHLPIYKSFTKTLRETRKLRYHVLLDVKHPEKHYLKKFRYIIRGFVIKRVAYFTFWGFLPLPLPFQIRLVIGLVILWCKDLWELIKTKRKMRQTNFCIRPIDQFLFIFLHWLVNIFETFYLLEGMVRFKLLQKVRI